MRRYERYAVCEKQNIRAYDYASIIALAIIGFEDLYLSQKKYEKIVNFYSKKILSEFNGWDEFIASFMLGELYKNSFEKKEDDEDDYEIISNLRLTYNALTLPYDIFQMSGIWENSVENAKEKLVPILEKRLDKNETHEQKELYEKKRKYYEEECAKLYIKIRQAAYYSKSFTLAFRILTRPNAIAIIAYSRRRINF